MDKPKISVVMPNYNGWEYIEEAIDSILNQSFTDFEFIIIDDWSSDNSWEIIEIFSEKDSRIVAIKNKENLKICKTLNKGIKIARWEYIARMDSDDIAMPEWLMKVYSKIENNPWIGICWSNFFTINWEWITTWKKKFPHTDSHCRDSIWFRNPFGHNTVIFRKDVVIEMWWYDEKMVYAEDLDLWLRIGSKYRFYNIQEYLVKYRIFWWNSILKNQKLMIKNALKARKNALKIGYKITLKWRMFYTWTWCMQFLPSKFVLWIFNKLVKQW